MKLEGTGTTPTSAFAWDGVQFRIIFNTENIWDSKPGALQELHVTDDAIAATLYHSSSTITYYFYPPRNEVVDRFEFTQDPHAEILSSWEAEIRWATNKDADSYLVWGRERTIRLCMPIRPKGPWSTVSASAGWTRRRNITTELNRGYPGWIPFTAQP
ncbi:MAG: hypothetical protein U5N26_00935 [Candidatus Marinimicrobia bacterium]|nr:hypothetical protein [Candidatus Neomarinimicrobiota bacterium]